MQHSPAQLATISAPADAMHVGEWVDESDDGNTWGHHLRGTRRATAGVSVTVGGWQDAGGGVERHANVSAADVQLDAAGLRKLAAIAVAAADELEHLKR